MTLHSITHDDAPPHESQPPDRRADEVLVRTMCDHEDLWPIVDAGAARTLLAWQVANAAGGVVDLAPLYRYVIDLGVDELAAATFAVDLADELDRVSVVAAVPWEVDDVLDAVELLETDDPRFARSWH